MAMGFDSMQTSLINVKNTVTSAKTDIIVNLSDFTSDG